jgi:hypothetical protein
MIVEVLLCQMLEITLIQIVLLILAIHTIMMDRRVFSVSRPSCLHYL